jgi:hypothetical protein
VAQTQSDRVWSRRLARAIAASCLAFILAFAFLATTGAQASIAPDAGPRIESRSDPALAVLPAEPQIVKTVLRQPQPKPELDDDGPVLVRADQWSMLAQARWVVDDGVPGPQAQLRFLSAWTPRGPPNSDSL